jgi:hypothetical protein
MALSGLVLNGWQHIQAARLQQHAGLRDTNHLYAGYKNYRQLQHLYREREAGYGEANALFP